MRYVVVEFVVVMVCVGLLWVLFMLLW